jgi:hypothetical protein
MVADLYTVCDRCANEQKCRDLPNRYDFIGEYNFFCIDTTIAYRVERYVVSESTASRLWLADWLTDSDYNDISASPTNGVSRISSKIFDFWDPTNARVCEDSLDLSNGTMVKERTIGIIWKQIIRIVRLNHELLLKINLLMILVVNCAV